MRVHESPDVPKRSGQSAADNTSTCAGVVTDIVESLTCRYGRKRALDQHTTNTCVTGDARPACASRRDECGTKELDKPYGCSSLNPINSAGAAELDLPRRRLHSDHSI
jgi:hypothetical protein